MKRLLLFALYDRDGRVDDHILYLLEALKPFREKAVVIVNGTPAPGAEARLAPVADRVILRPNQGFDFGAWGAVLPEYEKALETDFDALLLVNSSCFGPIFPLAEMFGKMERENCDFWSVTKYTRTSTMPAHWQSYFMEIRKPMAVSAAFRRFFREVGAKCTDFDAAVRYGEVGFSQAMTAAGFSGRAYVNMPDLRSAPNAGILENFSLSCAPFLISRFRLPLLKIKAFGQVPCAPIFRGRELFQALLDSGSHYPVELIVRYLRRTAPLSWQKNLPETLLVAERGKETGILPPLKIGVFLHCFHPEKAEQLLPFLARIPADFDWLVTSSKPETEAVCRSLSEKLPHLKEFFFQLVPNRGRDIAPWLCAFPGERHLSYDLALKLHIKESSRMPEVFTAQWMEYTLDNLAGSPALAAAVIRAFAAEPQLGILFPPGPPVVTLQCPDAYAGHPDDAAAGGEILKKLNLEPPLETGMPVFGAGTFFWYRPAALKPLLLFPWRPEDFPPEPLPWRGTAAHAMERLIPYIAQAEGFYFRQSLHADRLAEAFRTYENRILYDAPTLKRSLRILLRALQTSFLYRFRRLIRR